jgi:puromycin-sensitive aminopeptidase
LFLIQKSSIYLNDKNETVLKLNQKRFFTDGSQPTEAENYLWKVPISILTKSSYPKSLKEIVLDKYDDEINLGLISGEDWIKINKNTVGVYRTNYSEELLERLAVAIKEQSLHPTDRLGIQNDLFALSEAGLLPVNKLLKFIENYSFEDNMAVWQDLLFHLESMSRSLLSTDYEIKFKQYISKLVKQKAKKLGFVPIENESSLDSICRGIIFRILGINGDPTVLESAKNEFNKHVNGEQMLPVDMRSAVYSTILANEPSSGTMLETFFSLYSKADLEEERLRISVALGSVQDSKLIDKVLAFAIDPAMRTQESVMIIQSISSNSVSCCGSMKAWKLMSDNWDQLAPRFSSGFLFPRMIKCLLENLKADDITGIKEFFNKNSCPTAERSILQALENIEIGSKWFEREEVNLKSYLL